MSVRWIDAMMMYQWPLLCACWFKVYIINYANSLGFVIRTQYNDDDWLVCAFTALMMKYNVGTYLASRVYVSFIFCFDFVLFFVSILLWFVFGVGWCYSFAVAYGVAFGCCSHVITMAMIDVHHFSCLKWWNYLAITLLGNQIVRFVIFCRFTCKVL